MRWLQTMLRRVRHGRNPTQHWVQRAGVSAVIDIDVGSLDGVRLGTSISGLSHFGAGETMHDSSTLFFPSHGIWVQHEEGRLSSIRVSLEATAEENGSRSFRGTIRWRGRMLGASELTTVSDVRSIGGLEHETDCDHDETVLTYVADSHLIEFELRHSGIGSMLIVSDRH